MNTKVFGFTETAVEDIGRVIDTVKEDNYVVYKENINTKSLSCNKKSNKVINKLSAFIKRFIDICAGIVGCIVLIPLTIIVYILNFIERDGGPVFYTQDRIGKNGKTFKMIKYRSMVIDADKKLEQYLQENEEARKEYKKYKKLKNDPRITKVGKFLRKTSLDEMPQLIHLLTGEMSLVGPRPYLPREKEEMGEYYNIIIQDKPGITGLWQASGRSNTTFNDRLDMDVVYHKENSLKNDIKILLKTALDVVKKEGAV